MAIGTVVFDIGNVLLRWSPLNLSRRLGMTDEAARQAIEETGLIEVNHEFDRGRPFAEGIAELVARHPRHRTFLEAFDSRWMETLDGAIEENVALLRDLKAAGVPVHAISNFSREKLDPVRQTFPFLNVFDEAVVSADVGLLKPDPAIFHVLLARRALDPATCVFIDDVKANIATAARLGFETVHFIDGEVDVRARLRRLGLPVS